jgi:DNA-binding SARP family transcriptional activator
MALEHVCLSGHEERTRGARPLPASSEESGAGKVELRVLGSFGLVSGGHPVSVGASCRRLLTLLAVTGGATNRMDAARLLWQEAASGRARANLRSVLWRVQRYHCGVVKSTTSEVLLASEVTIDLHRVQRVAWRILERSSPLAADEIREAMECNLYKDIYSDPSDQAWLVSATTRHRRLRLHALEALADELTGIGWLGAAIEAACGSVRADPYRESARQVLIKAYLAEGNVLDARREHATYCHLLQRELGVNPSQQFMRILGAR